MNLILDIIGGDAQSLGSARRKVFGPEGGRIGRAPDCDWVLTNPYVSRHHATIRWISGTYYIESAGENGVALGSPQGMIPKLERRPLKHGDHLFIDEYEVVVGLDGIVADTASAPSAGAAGRAFAPADDPFDLAPTQESRILTDPLEPPADELDPLKQIGAQAGSPVATAPREESSWNHTPGISDQFAPPPATAASPSAQIIPENWDRTTFGRAKSSQAAPPHSAAAEAARGAPVPAAAIPDDWDKTNFSRKPATSAAPTPRPAVPKPAPALRRPEAAAAGGPGASSGASERERLVTRAARPQGGVSTASRASSPTAAAVPPQPQGAPDGFDVASLLKSAGVDPAGVPPETAASLGLILRSVVQGVIDVLRARAEIKEQFRLTQTIVKTAENNPLKFAVSAEDALNSLLGRRNSAYLAPVEAFEDAFADIRCHQLAMLAGMRAGFDHVMSRFDPQQLQERIDKRSRRGGLLSMNAKSRYWERFTEEFQEMAADHELAFRRLFAEEFAAAYEKQLEQLKRTHSK